MSFIASGGSEKKKKKKEYFSRSSKVGPSALEEVYYLSLLTLVRD